MMLEEQSLAAANEKPLNADKQYTEGQEDLKWGVVEKDKRRVQQKVTNLRKKQRKDRSSQHQR